jgi:hypothetical protein
MFLTASAVTAARSELSRAACWQSSRGDLGGVRDFRRMDAIDARKCRQFFRTREIEAFGRRQFPRRRPDRSTQVPSLWWPASNKSTLVLARRAPDENRSTPAHANLSSEVGRASLVTIRCAPCPVRRTFLSDLAASLPPFRRSDWVSDATPSTWRSARAEAPCYRVRGRREGNFISLSSRIASACSHASLLPRPPLRLLHRRLRARGLV